MLAPDLALAARKLELNEGSLLPELDRTALFTTARRCDTVKLVRQMATMFPDVLSLLKQLGMDPFDAGKATGIYAKNIYTDAPTVRSFQNIGIHNLVVGRVALAIARYACQSGLLGLEEVDTVARGGSLHDAGKPAEIMRKQAKDQGRYTGDVYSDIAYEDVGKYLDRAGVDPTLATTIAQYGQETGPGSLKRLISLDRSGSFSLIPGRMLQKIVHLSDAMVYTAKPNEDPQITTILTPWERFTATNARVNYPEDFIGGLAVGANGELVDVPDFSQMDKSLRIVGSYQLLLVAVPRAICRELNVAAKMQGDIPADARIKDLVWRDFDDSN